MVKLGESYRISPEMHVNRGRELRMFDVKGDIHVDNYLSALFDLNDSDRKFVLLSGMYKNLQDMQDALAAVYMINTVIGTKLFNREPDWAISVVEREGSRLPKIGALLAGIFGFPTISIGKDLKVPNIDTGISATAMFSKQYLTVIPDTMHKFYKAKVKENLIVVIPDTMSMAWGHWKLQSEAERVMIVFSKDTDTLRYASRYPPKEIVMDKMSNLTTYIGIYD